MNFPSPLFLSPLLSCFSYPSNIEIIFDFSDIITKINPPSQTPGSAPEKVGNRMGRQNLRPATAPLGERSYDFIQTTS